MEEQFKTTTQYDHVIDSCKLIFLKKNKDYGSSWVVLRPSAITDQLFIKVKRIKSIEEKGNSKVNEPVLDEYFAIVNYCVIALIALTEQIEPSQNAINSELLESYYDKQVLATKNLMIAKNHDYGEAWRDMRISTFTDMMLMRIFRIKEIEDKGGKTFVSEGVEANYRDMMNYAIFALIRLNELS